MLTSLSGKTHQVFTAITLLYFDVKSQNVQRLSDVEKTDVTFCELDDETIRSYVDTREPLDKAGAYGIQGLASLFVSSISGQYFNVVGFPTHTFFQMIMQIQRDLRS
eukprot:TRINITY_DN524_c0_g1_i1.p2 TRINITY_DN524_c0_g1~~TRINITY_DN524_c0_g1_i1.p2  ORF type:complete len:107 (+),score=13.51 TRINITY_DN524_c0_g1_i1:352-672(+)